MSRHLYPHVFGSGPTITSPLSLRHYAKRMVLPCGFTTIGDMSWTPAMQLESTDPLLWLRFWESDYSVSTGGARQFYSADKTSLQHVDNAFFSTGDIDFLWAGWVYFDSLGDQYIFSKDTTTREYGLRNTSGNSLTFSIWDAASTQKDAAWATTTVAGRWYFFVGWHDATANTVNLQIDNGAIVSTATAGIVPRDAAAAFCLGNYGLDLSIGLKGRTSRLCLLKNSAARAVIDSAATRTSMYNLGRGILSGNLDLLLADLGTFTAGTDWDAWNLNETDGTAAARSFSGLNDLTPTFGELISNGGFETAGGGGADVFGSWMEAVAGTGAVNDEAVNVDAGSHAARLTGGDSYGYVYQNVLVAGRRYYYSLRARYVTSGNMTLYIGNTNAIILTLTGSYATYSGTTTASGDTAFAPFAAAGQDAYVDTVSVTATQIPACDGPSSDIAPDTGSVGTAHGQLIGFADSETARSTDVPSAIGSGTSLSFDGVDDYVSCGSIGAVTEVSFYVKLLIDNQEILTLANSTATAVTVAAGVLTFGASLTASAITVDGVSMSAADAGAALNDNAWHLLAFSLTSISATGVKLGTDSSAYGQIMLDDVKFNAGTLAYYTFDEETSLSISDGDPIAVAQSLEGSRYQLLNATASERPDYVASAINGKPGLEFDGVDDLLEYVGVPLTGTAGTIIAIYKVKAVPDAYQVVIASSDTATTNKRMVLYARGNTANPHLGYSQQNADTEDLLDGNTSVTDELECASYWASDGTTVTARLNGTAQTLNADTGANNGDWWDDSTGKDTTTIGALKHTSETNHAAIILCELIAYPINLSDASRATVEAYILREYGLTL